MLALATGIRGASMPSSSSCRGDAGGLEARAAGLRAVPEPIRERPGPAPRPRNLDLKRLGIVIATALAAINVCTGAPLLALWIGSRFSPKVC